LKEDTCVLVVLKGVILDRLHKSLLVPSLDAHFWGGNELGRVHIDTNQARTRTSWFSLNSDAYILI